MLHLLTEPCKLRFLLREVLPTGCLGCPCASNPPGLREMLVSEAEVNLWNVAFSSCGRARRHPTAQALPTAGCGGTSVYSTGSVEDVLGTWLLELSPNCMGKMSPIGKWQECRGETHGLWSPVGSQPAGSKDLERTPSMFSSLTDMTAHRVCRTSGGYLVSNNHFLVRITFHVPHRDPDHWIWASNSRLIKWEPSPGPTHHSKQGWYTGLSSTDLH